jgi:hypothetical protein
VIGGFGTGKSAPRPRAFAAMFTNPELASGRECPRGEFCVTYLSDLPKVKRPHWLWSHIGPYASMPDTGEPQAIAAPASCEICMEYFSAMYDVLFTRVERGRRHLWRRRS